MQFKFTFVIAALATLVSATPTLRGEGGTCPPAESCSTGPIKCCESLTTATSTICGAVLTTLGITLPNTNVNVGLTCTSLVGGTCNGQAVCCSDNSHGTLISVGCVPVQL
ncbi:hypothetical protein D9757_007876 [Collybiopsis confluens]|uniref:Hydrophobin n=1 Tax=Collybiopsis confluens TaxID=2823264 RepID=A0A8H5HD75_9AGAR|nr:hypothetical protein D9757_007876 [Collybiopsis confluens]